MSESISPSDETPVLPFVPSADSGSRKPPEPPAIAAAGAPPDPFDPQALRLSQDFAVGLGVRKALITVPVRKPSREAFVQVHPSEDYRIATGVVELKDDREVYLVAPALREALMTEPTYGPRILFTAITRQGDVFLWPIRMPDPNGRIDSWNESAREAARRAQGRWVRVAANMNVGGYDLFSAPSDLPPPVWPAESLSDLLRIAFRDKYIDSLDHIVLRKLRGEV